MTWTSCRCASFVASASKNLIKRIASLVSKHHKGLGDSSLLGASPDSSSLVSRCPTLPLPLPPPPTGSRTRKSSPEIFFSLSPVRAVCSHKSLIAVVCCRLTESSRKHPPPPPPLKQGGDDGRSGWNSNQKAPLTS